MAAYQLKIDIFSDHHREFRRLDVVVVDRVTIDHCAINATVNAADRAIDDVQVGKAIFNIIMIITSLRLEE